MKKITYVTLVFCLGLFSCKKDNSLLNNKTTAISPGASHSSTTTCTFINSWKATAGYAPKSNSTTGAIWVQWKLNPCTSPSGQGIRITLTVTKSSTGEVLYTIPGSYAQQTVDFDNMELGTSYHVNYEITDYGTGVVIESRSADLTTPSHNPVGI